MEGRVHKNSSIILLTYVLLGCPGSGSGGWDGGAPGNGFEEDIGYEGADPMEPYSSCESSPIVEPDPAPELIAENLEDDWWSNLVADNSNLYWTTTSGLQDGAEGLTTRLMKYSLKTGELAEFSNVSSAPIALATDDGPDLFYLDYFTRDLFRLSKLDGSDAMIADGPFAQLVKMGDSIYLLDDGGAHCASKGRLVVYDVAEGTLSELVAGLDCPSSIAPSDAAVYVTLDGVDQVGHLDDSLVRVDLRTGATVAAAQTVGRAMHMVPLDDGVYFYFEEELTSVVVSTDLSLAHMDAMGLVTVLSKQCELIMGMIRYENQLLVATGKWYTLFGTDASASMSFGDHHGFPASFVVVGHDLYFTPATGGRIERLPIPEPPIN